MTGIDWIPSLADLERHVREWASDPEKFRRGETLDVIVDEPVQDAAIWLWRIEVDIEPRGHCIYGCRHVQGDPAHTFEYVRTAVFRVMRKRYEDTGSGTVEVLTIGEETT